MDSMASLAISEASKICLPSTKAFWASKITFPTTFLSLLAYTLANHLYSPPTKLIGLKSLKFSAPTAKTVKRGKENIETDKTKTTLTRAQPINKTN